MKIALKTGLVAVIALLVIFSVIGTGMAATNLTFVVALTTAGQTCATSQWTISFSWTAVTADFPDGSDGVAMIAYDGYGVPISADWNGWTPGNTFTETTSFGNGAGINAMTARPITVEVYDLGVGPFLPLGENLQSIYDDVVARAAAGAPLVTSAVVDPADAVPDCASLPLVSGEEPEEPVVAVPVPGCDALIAIPSTAVGAKITADTLAYWTPGQATDTLLKAGTSVRAIAQEDGYYEILFACDFLYVPVGTIGPNPESPWFGAQLP
ncbi:MAG: hypothetical protein ACUVSU_05390 [Aggregatilineaceae bacterium]